MAKPMPAGTPASMSWLLSASADLSLAPPLTRPVPPAQTHPPTPLHALPPSPTTPTGRQQLFYGSTVCYDYWWYYPYSCKTFITGCLISDDYNWHVPCDYAIAVGACGIFFSMIACCFQVRRLASPATRTSSFTYLAVCGRGHLAGWSCVDADVAVQRRRARMPRWLCHGMQGRRVGVGQ